MTQDIDKLAVAAMQTDKIPDEIMQEAERLAYNCHPTEIALALMARDKRAADRLEAVEARLAEAMGVLKPFAAQSDKIHSGYDAGIAAGDHPMWHVFVSDLRAARRLVVRLSAQERDDGR